VEIDVLSLRTLLFKDRCKHNVPETCRSMIALQIQGAGLHRIRPQRSAGTAQQRFIVNDLLAVQYHGHVPIQQGNTHALPLSRRFLRAHRRRDAAIDGAHVMGIEGFSVGIEDLKLVDAAKIDAAVGFLRHVDLKLQIEILEFVDGPQIAIRNVSFAFGLCRPEKLTQV